LRRSVDPVETRLHDEWTSERLAEPARPRLPAAAAACYMAAIAVPASTHSPGKRP